MIAVAAAIFIWRTALPAAQAKTYAFSAYYTAAHLTIEGQGGVGFCEQWFFEQERALGFGNLADYFCPNPPTNALAMVPVAWLPPEPARYGWIAIDLALIAASLAIGWRIVGALSQSLPRLSADGGRRTTNDQRLKDRPERSEGTQGQRREVNEDTSAVAGAPWPLVVGRWSWLGYAAVAAVAVALYRPLHADMHAGQVYTLLGLFYTLWLYGFVTDSDWISGVGLAGLVLLKLAGWPLWLLMIAARRWRALAWAIGVGTAVGLLTLPLFGLEFWLTYLFGQAPSIPADPSGAVPANQTLLSLLRQLFVYDARWSPRPLVDAPWLANLAWWLLALALLAPTLRLVVFAPAPELGRGSALAARAGLAMLCLVVPLQPAGEEHHYTLLLVVVLVLLAAPAVAPRVLLGDAALALGFVLLVLPAYFLATAAWAGWPQALLAYPRVYGTLLLWGALVVPVSAQRRIREARRRARIAPSSGRD